ncbi:MAG: hypothetical protein QMD04_11465, partial [Anaerolineales bacterium]|nr:hypothetical protein [Anaerolineales bacterium]
QNITQPQNPAESGKFDRFLPTFGTVSTAGCCSYSQYGYCHCDERSSLPEQGGIASGKPPSQRQR